MTAVASLRAPLGPVRRWAGAVLLLAALATGCGPREDRAALVRRRILPRSETGWVRVPLDRAACTAAGQPWIGDDAGRAVPSLRAAADLWGPRQLEIDKLLLGADSEGRSIAEFSLRIPPLWSLGDREQVRFDLDLQGRPPWACRVEVARRLEGAALLGLPRASPFQLHDLTGRDAATSLVVPWDARDYRLVLHPVTGLAPNLRSLKVTAVTDPGALEPDRLLPPTESVREVQSPAMSRWRLRWSTPERVIGVEVQLAAPAPPAAPEVFLPAAAGKDENPAPPRRLKTTGLLWNLPKGGAATRVAVEPVLTDQLLVTVPSGASVAAVKLLIQDDHLLFRAEAGHPYWLHLGGRAKPAGDPGPLPPSRLVYARDPARLGPTEPDPQGLARLLPTNPKAWLRSGAIAGAILLAAAVLLLLRRRG